MRGPSRSPLDLPWQVRKHNSERLQEGGHRWIIEFLGLGSRVKVNFTQPFWYFFNQLLENGLGHFAGLSQPENSVGKFHALGEKRGLSRPTQKMKNSTDQRSRGGFTHQTNRSKPSLKSDRQSETKDRRMEMQMEVTVPISGRQTEGEKAIKLTSDFVLECRNQPGGESVAKSRPRRGHRQISMEVGQRRNLTSQSRTESEVEPHLQAGTTTSHRHRLSRSGFIDHQAGLGEHARAVGPFDRGIDRGAPPKVICGNNQVFQNSRRAGNLTCLTLMIRRFSTPLGKA